MKRTGKGLDKIFTALALDQLKNNVIPDMSAKGYILAVDTAVRIFEVKKPNEDQIKAVTMFEEKDAYLLKGLI